MSVINSQLYTHYNNIEFATELKAFASQLRMNNEKDKVQAEKKAREALIRTGVYSEQGVLKDQIVSWD